MKAIEEGTTLKELFIRSLKKELGKPVSSSKEAPWKKLKGKGSASAIEATDSPFDDYSGPDWVQSFQVNEPE